MFNIPTKSIKYKQYIESFNFLILIVYYYKFSNISIFSQKYVFKINMEIQYLYIFYFFFFKYYYYWGEGQSSPISLSLQKKIDHQNFLFNIKITVQNKFNMNFLFIYSIYITKIEFLCHTCKNTLAYLVRQNYSLEKNCESATIILLPGNLLSWS